MTNGDFGWSRTAQRPVLDAIIYYFPATLELALLSILPIVGGGVFLGVQAAVHRDKAHRPSRTHLFHGRHVVSGICVCAVDADDFLCQPQWFPPGRFTDDLQRVVNNPTFHQYTGMYTLDGC